MAKMVTILGDVPAYHILKGTAILYALDQSDDTQRPIYLKTIETNEVVRGMKPIALDGKTYCAALKLLGASRVSVCDVYEDACVVYSAEHFEKDVISFLKLQANDSLQYERIAQYNQTAFEDAQKRFSSVNQDLVALRQVDSHQNALVMAFERISKYLGNQVIVPTQDTLETAEAFEETLFRLSDVSSRPVMLTAGWHQKHSGALLAYLKDDTPVALIPMGIQSYRLYNPVTNTEKRVTSELAEQVRLEATSLMREFPDKPMTGKEVLRFILGEHIYAEIAVIILFSLLATLVATLPPIFSQQIFDNIVPNHHIGMLVEIIFILVAFQLAAMGFNILINLSFSRIKMKIDLSMQGAIWRRLLGQSTAFFLRHTPGELINRVSGLSAVNARLTLPLLQSLPTMFFSFVNVYVLYRYCPDITPTLLLLFAGLFVIAFFINREIYRVQTKLFRAQDNSVSLNHQFLAAMPRVQASFAQNSVYSVWSKNRSHERALSSRVSMLKGVLEALYTFFSFASVAVVYLLIAGQSNVDIGTFVAYIATFLTFQSVVISFLRTLNILPDIMPSLKRLSPILQSVPEIVKDKAIPKNLDGTIELRNVSFQYDKQSMPVLHDISFRLKKGESLGIVGKSGCGKSTLLKLLLGMYQPTNGLVFVGAYNLKEVDLFALRHQIGVAMQNADLSTGTLFQAIIENDDSLTETDVWNVLEKVEMADEVRAMPHGLYTLLENAGEDFSFGQRQRLAVARAIIKQRPYLFMDETTSHLDNLAQARVMQAIEEMHTTKVIVAQRLKTVEKCDKLLVLQEGRVVAFGAYAELIHKQHLYDDVFDDAQEEEDEIDGESVPLDK